MRRASPTNAVPFASLGAATPANRSATSNLGLAPGAACRTT
jgi:hypothetical protein